MDSEIVALLKPAVSVAAGRAIDSLTSKIGATTSTATTLEADLLSHLGEIASWSERLEFYGLSQALAVEEATIGLDIALTPRKFAGLHVSREWTEDDLLATPKHHILLGDPGAGKTTTIKRLCRTLLTKDSSSENDFLQYPVVLRFRTFKDTEGVHVRLAKALGIRWSFEELSDSDRKSGKQPRKLVDNLELLDALVLVIDKTRPLICLDGLDEAPVQLRQQLETEIELLASRVKQGKILLTTRSGDFQRSLGSFDVLELKPLTDPQIKTIARACLPGKADSFVSSVLSLPYSESMRRPLALFQLVVLYRNYGELAEQPSSVYQKLVSLYIEDWDFQNRINRVTRYANLPPNRKLEFLASFAHFMLFRAGSVSYSFSSSDIAYAYSQIHESFGLPEEECMPVVYEIESHTGIIMQSGPDTYEFSDASQQEFLAAHFLSKDPFPDDLLMSLGRNPGAIAITVVLANDPTKWMAAAFLNPRTPRQLIDIELKIPEFLRRLRIERPHFVTSGVLGFVFMQIVMCLVHNEEAMDEIEALMSMFHTILASMSKALSAYSVVGEETLPTISLKLNRSDEYGQNVIVPNYGHLPRRLYDMARAEAA